MAAWFVVDTACQQQRRASQSNLNSHGQSKVRAGPIVKRRRSGFLRNRNRNSRIRLRLRKRPDARLPTDKVPQREYQWRPLFGTTAFSVPRVDDDLHVLVEQISIVNSRCQCAQRILLETSISQVQVNPTSQAYLSSGSANWRTGLSTCWRPPRPSLPNHSRCDLRVCSATSWLGTMW